MDQEKFSCDIKFVKSESIDNKVLLTITPPKTGPKNTTNLIISYDRSYSMSSSANPNGDEITKYYSKNDVLRHAIFIALDNLGSDDTAEIITYDSIVETVLPRTIMNKDGKEKAKLSINKIEPRGCTELWKGLKAALNAAQKTTSELGYSTILMMTDGEPSNSPGVGEIQALKDYRKQNNNNCPIHTIGIGYDVKSKLLLDLTENGEYDGSFKFIPDGSMVITTLVNYLANQKNIFRNNLNVVIGNKTIKLGSIKYGQPKSILLDISDVNSISSIQYNSSDNKSVISIDSSINKSVHVDHTSVVFEIVRSNIIETLSTMLKYGDVDINKCQEISRDAIMAAFKMIDDHPSINDLRGEIALAFQTTNALYNWGMHYTRSLYSGHKNSECLNFKDPGLKQYESEEIIKSKESIDQIAMATEVPQPSISMISDSRGYSSTPSQPVTQDQYWASYNNAQGGCFGGNNLAEKNDGTYQFIKYLKKGDILKNDAEIICVVVFENADLITIQDSVIEMTPLHPIQIGDNDKWVHPNTCTVISKSSNNVVYNFILKDYHKIHINGSIRACTLAHGFTDDDVIKHEFYGTQKVFDDLKSFPSFESGRITITEKNLIRNSNNEITGYISTN
jgi:hypothetical protein